ncbi:hypothetical protein BTHERMOSOX_1523 [Bathymodiolus thermophilus thioautotrophic gill symbiont]|uniref:DUF1302 family protein n=1 Tax=Bathymodiolus thermophilus thioautotrophic gill symbiont TaxID=2360 RepID=UPI0010B28E8F|nr:DUF1302 family protein [Bathymodiolus thermophilus thioautotrophic gill symbiont]SGZ60335.1 hypothetical protein BTHERMOSOX_1523 [Bathymodiolus thermophilus thioautotrophic gill symbiont]
MKLILLFSLLLTAFLSNAEEEFDDGFDDNIDDIIIETAPPPEKNAVYGSVNFETHYNLNNNKNISSTKLLLDLTTDYKMDNGFKVNSNLKAYHDFIFYASNNYETTPSNYENELNLNELNIEGSINANLDFKIGRQIVVWGKSDSIRITDILNPLDNRAPGLIDIKNLRLGRLMSKLDYYQDNLKFSTAILHENRFSENPKFGSDFKNSADLPENTPSNGLKNTGIALSLTGEFSGYDFGVYFADTYLDKPYFKEGALQFDNRSKMLGLAYNKVVDSFLLKTEIAYFNNIKYTGLNDTKSRIDSLIGVEYTGISDGSIGYELALRKINHYDAIINTQFNNFTQQETYQHALRFTQSYLNQTLNLTAISGVFGKQGDAGGFARISLEYAIDDKLSISGGIIDYIGGSTATDAIKNNDRIFTKISYSF